MRAAPVTFTVYDSIAYGHVDYSRLVKAQGGVVVVNDAEDDETARQKIVLPAGDVVLGLGPNASATPAAARLLGDLGIRVISTSGADSLFEPFSSPVLAQRQARAYASDAARADVARHLYRARFVDSSLIESAPLSRLIALDENLTDETYAKYVARFKPARFKRHADGIDPTNRALTLTENLLRQSAADVCRLLGLSTALGVVREDGRLAFAGDLADAFRLDVTISVGFIVGSRKLKDPAEVYGLVAENLHHHRVLPRMLEMAQAAFTS